MANRVRNSFGGHRTLFDVQGLSRGGKITARNGCATRLFRADGQDIFTADLDFYAERRTNVTALNDSAANPYIACKAGGFQRVVKSAATGIAYQRMFGGAILVFRAQFVDVGDIFQLAGAIRSFAREGPVSGRLGCGAARQAHDSCGHAFTGQSITNEEISGRPGFG